MELFLTALSGDAWIIVYMAAIGIGLARSAYVTDHGYPACEVDGMPVRRALGEIVGTSVWRRCFDVPRRSRAVPGAGRHRHGHLFAVA